jgi:signal transduction histidine kinase
MSVLIVLPVSNEMDTVCDMPSKLWSNPKVVSDIIAISGDVDLKSRMKILAKGFDIVYSSKVIHRKDFKNSIRNRVKKCTIRLQSQIQADEYAQLRAALSASPAAFLIFDVKKRLFFISDDFQEIFKDHIQHLEKGSTSKETLSHFINSKNFDKENNEYSAIESFWLDLEGQIDVQLINKQIWRLESEPLSDNQGTIVTATNITEYITTQELLQKKSSDLQDALSKEKESAEIQKQFIAMVSHEFRTPLTIIDGNAQIIEKRGTQISKEDLVKRSKAIRAAVSRLIYLMEGTLSSNLLESGNMELIIEDVDLQSLIKELAEAQCQISKKLNIELDIEALPDNLKLDKKVLTLSLTNLISNADKFSEDTANIVITSFIEDDTLKIIVKDDGIGIPENELNKIFDKYYRSSLSHNVTGSGIGLNLVKGLINLHGGKIDAQSEEGEGTSFSIKIPLS